MRPIIFAALIAVSATTPALAADDEKLGLAAALGLTAADGKTVLGDGAGATEATLLASESIDLAGAIIARLVATPANGRRVLILTGTDSVDLGSPGLIRSQLDDLAERLKGPCPLKIDKADDSDGSRNLAAAAATPRLDYTDLAAAFARSTSYSAIAVKADDRLLADAVLLNRGAVGASTTRQADAPGKDGQAAATATAFVIVAEAQAIAETSALWQSYRTVVKGANRLRACGEFPPYKAAIGAADAYVTAITTNPEKGGPSPLVAAVQLESAISVVARDDTKAPQAADANATKAKSADSKADSALSPYVLRLAIDHAGGTGITRSSIWYTLGFPGAALVSSGLLASFRLIDPVGGRPVMVGLVRCASRPLNIRSVAGRVTGRDGWVGTLPAERRAERQKFAYCAYKAS